MPASRRQLFTAGAAAGIGVFATRAGAANFGNPDEPPQGIVNTQGNPRSAVDPGPQNPTLSGQFPKAFIPPATDVGDLPLFWASFNNAPRRIQDGGWARQVTQADFQISEFHFRREHAPQRGWSAGIALAPGRRVGLHDLRQLPRHRDRPPRPRLRRRHDRGRPLVFPGRIPSLLAGPRAGRVPSSSWPSTTANNRSSTPCW